MRRRSGRNSCASIGRGEAGGAAPRPEAVRLARLRQVPRDRGRPEGQRRPSLAEAGKRFTAPYVVESILLPSKQVADAFRATTLTLTDGRVLTGLVVNETADAPGNAPAGRHAEDRPEEGD